MNLKRTTTKRTRTQRGFSLVEVAISVAVLAVAAGGIMGLSAQVARQRLDTSERMRAADLADAMLAELQTAGYGSNAVIYADLVAPNTNDRLGFNDLDDYHRWTASPPIERDGSPADGGTGLTRSVEVTWAGATSGLEVTAPTGVKVVTVRVERSGRTLAVRRFTRSETGGALFAEAWPGDPVASRELGTTDPGTTDDTYIDIDILRNPLDSTDLVFDTKLGILDLEAEVDTGLIVK